MKRAVVIGAGWAGCSAAHELSQRGWTVTLIERSKNLGGRAGSSLNAKLGLQLDCGQHLFLGAYQESLRLLQALGTDDAIQLGKRLELDYFTSQGVVSLKAWPLRGPLALGGALLGFPLLSAREKREAFLLGLKGWRGLWNPSSLKRLTAGSWLKRCGQSPGLIRKFWEPLCLAALNVPSAKAPAELLAVVLKRGFLRGGRTAALGFPLKPLSQLLQPALVEKLQGAGSKVRFGLGSKSVKKNKDRFNVSLENGETLEAEGVVIALPASLAAKQVNLDLKAAASIEGSPILTAHLFSEHTILPSAWGVFAAEEGDLGFEFHWAFDRTQVSNERGPAGETWTCFLASAARRMAGMSQDAILTELKRQLVRRFPNFDPSEISKALVLKEARATPYFEPGASRPSQKTAITGLALAGDWTDTGLPATIEGAVISGLRAAKALD